jgi:NADPH-dependent 2,4-dienoyl-CoA reductase/sulfur reductase-like enzyme
MIDRIVIVGGGLAAARVARAFRDAGGEASVTILSADTDPPYNRPPLSKGFLRGEMEADAVFVEPQETYAELNIDLRLGCEVMASSPATRP